MHKTVVDVTHAAAEDLERLHDFLCAQEEPLADIWMEFIQEAFSVLEKQPGIGRPQPGDLRELIIQRGRTGYLALYRYVRDRHYVRVLRIRHQRESGYTEDEM